MTERSEKKEEEGEYHLRSTVVDWYLVHTMETFLLEWIGTFSCFSLPKFEHMPWHCSEFEGTVPNTICTCIKMTKTTDEFELSFTLKKINVIVLLCVHSTQYIGTYMGQCLYKANGNKTNISIYMFLDSKSILAKYPTHEKCSIGVVSEKKTNFSHFR